MDSKTLTILIKAKDEASKALEGVGSSAESSGLRIKSALGFGTVVAASQVAFNAIKNNIVNNIDSAVTRVDTLNNSTKVFENLGFKASDVKKAMNDLNIAIQGLPTSLDQGVEGMQSLAMQSGNIQTAEKSFKAMNDAVLASGGSTAQLSNAIGQLTQLDLKGPLDAQTWNSLRQSGMEPAMKMMADMSGKTMAQLKDSFGNGTLTVEDFLNMLQKLDKDGTGNMSSLEKQAKDMSGGIKTGMSNASTAVTRGLADIIKAIGSTNISNAISAIGNGMENALGAIAKSVPIVESAIGTTANIIKTLLPVIGTITAGMIAYRAAIAAINAVETIHSALMVAQGAQFMLLNGQLVAVRTATVAQTVAQTALNLVMAANPIALVIAAVAALAGGLALLGFQTDSNKNADDRLKDARNQLTQATNAAKDAQNNLKEAQLQQEGASLRVEQAQKTYNDAVAQFGPKSLEARQAAYDLRVAQEGLKKANNEAADATNKNSDIQEKLAEQKSKIEEAEKIKKSVIEKTTQSMREQANRTSDLFGSLNTLNGRNFSYTVTQNNKTVGSDITHKASGGPVKANEPYFVGDNPDGSINKTTELFIPNTSGTIMSSSDLQAALSGAKNGPQRIDKSSTFNMYGNIQLGDASAVDRFFEKMDKQAQLANAGVGV